MQFGQLIEYKKRNIFLQKPCGKWDKQKSFIGIKSEVQKHSYKIEQRGRVTENNVTLPVTDSTILIEILLSSYYLSFLKH